MPTAFAAAVLWRRLPQAGVELSIPFRLRAAGDLQMPHTHYVPYFKGLLDYVWWVLHRAGALFRDTLCVWGCKRDR